MELEEQLMFAALKGGYGKILRNKDCERDDLNAHR